MKTNNKVDGLFHCFLYDQVHEIKLDGFSVVLQISPHDLELIISIPIYQGKGSIPRIIQEQALTDVYFDEDVIDNYITLDKQNHRVLVNHCVPLESVNYAHFTELLDELLWVAKEWKSILDEEGVRDLQFVWIARS